MSSTLSSRTHISHGSSACVTVEVLQAFPRRVAAAGTTLLSSPPKSPTTNRFTSTSVSRA